MTCQLNDRSLYYTLYVIKFIRCFKNNTILEQRYLQYNQELIGVEQIA